MPTYVQALNGFKIKRLSYYIWLSGCILSASTACSSYAGEQSLSHENAQLQHIKQDDIEAKEIETNDIKVKGIATKEIEVENIEPTDAEQNIAVAVAAESDQIMLKDAPVHALEFDSSALMGSLKERDLSVYSTENPAIVGTYPVQIYINGDWKGSQELKFETIAETQKVEHCFSFEELLTLNVDVKRLKNIDRTQCLTLDQWINQAQSRLNSSQFRYDLTIPQAFLKRSSRGEVPFELWDRGINAAFLSYDFNHRHNQFDGQSFNDRYLRLNAGVNLASWQLRHNAVVTQNAHQSSQYDRINSYAQRAFPQYGTLATVGESFSLGHFMPSFPFTGVELKSDDRMLPETQRGYAPIIRGVAKTNATVEVRQSGQLIHQMTVQPGAFIVDDLYDTGSSGDLEVTVREVDGSIQSFKVPFSSVNLALRDGQQRYSVTAGQLRQENLADEKFIQASYQRGLNNFMTSYAASTLSQVYQAYQLGAAFLTPIGAVSFDVTHADTKSSTTNNVNEQYNFGPDTGQNYRVMYNKTFLPSFTSVSLSASHQTGQGFYHFQDAVQAREYFENGQEFNGNGRRKNQFFLNIQQNLGNRWGSLYLTASRSDYIGNKDVETDYQIGYSNNYKNLNYSLSMQRVRDAWGQSDQHYYAMLTLPLSLQKPQMSVSQYVTDTGNGTNMNATFGHHREVTVNANLNDLGYSHSSQHAGIQYRSPYATASLGSTLYGGSQQQYSSGLSGAVVMHSKGISFSPEMVDTMVLVKAPKATGAAVKNTSGLKIDRWGYAVIPFVSAYRKNEIVLDPNAVVDQVDLMSTIQETAPYAGAISRVEFKTQAGIRLVIKSRQPNGQALPFAASVQNEAGENIGFVAQGSQILLRTDQTQANLVVKWGDAEDEKCHLSYQLDKDTNNTSGFQQIKEQCQ